MHHGVGVAVHVQHHIGVDGQAAEGCAGAWQLDLIDSLRRLRQQVVEHHLEARALVEARALGLR